VHHTRQPSSSITSTAADSTPSTTSSSIQMGVSGSRIHLMISSRGLGRNLSCPRSVANQPPIQYTSRRDRVEWMIYYSIPRASVSPRSLKSTEDVPFHQFGNIHWGQLPTFYKRKLKKAVRALFGFILAHCPQPGRALSASWLRMFNASEVPCRSADVNASSIIAGRDEYTLSG
jgi:hypothetical protein